MSNEAGNAFKLTLPNASLSNNCLILKIYYPSGVSVSSIVDDSNTWSTTPIATVTDAGNSIIVAVFAVYGATAGAKTITVTFSSTATTAFNPAFQEWTNIATSSALDGTPSAIVGVGTRAAPGIENIASGSFNTSSDGDLILHFGQVTGWANNGDAGRYMGVAAAGQLDGISKIDRDTGYTLAQVDLDQGYFCEYTVQATHGATNPAARVTDYQNAGWASITLALKSASAGTAPSAGTRVFGLQHFKPVGTGGTGLIDYPWQFPRVGNTFIVGTSDPSDQIQVFAINGPINGPWTKVTSTTGEPTMLYKTSGIATDNEVMILTLWDQATHNYVQGCMYDIVYGGQYDTSANVSNGSFTIPGNTLDSPAITPGVSSGIVVNVVGLATGPPDSLVTPGGVFVSVYYTGESDASSMDNGDCHGFYVYSSNATQHWVYHDAGSGTSGDANGVAVSISSGPQITSQPTNQYAYPGRSVTFSVTASASSGSLSYQWYKNGNSIGSATSSTYTFTPNIQTGVADTYYVKVTDSNSFTYSATVEVIFYLPMFPTKGLHAADRDDGSQDYKSELTLLRWF